VLVGAVVLTFLFALALVLHPIADVGGRIKGHSFKIEWEVWVQLDVVVPDHLLDFGGVWVQERVLPYEDSVGVDVAGVVLPRAVLGAGCSVGAVHGVGYDDDGALLRAYQDSGAPIGSVIEEAVFFVAYSRVEVSV
jgi:hypothetical protein